MSKEKYIEGYKDGYTDGFLEAQKLFQEKPQIEYIKVPYYAPYYAPYYGWWGIYPPYTGTLSSDTITITANGTADCDTTTIKWSDYNVITPTAQIDCI